MQMTSGTSNGAVLRYEGLLTMIVVATVTLIVGLMLGLGWKTCLLLMSSVAVFTGGVLFTFLEMHRLGLGSSLNAARFVQQEPSSANRSPQLEAAANLRRLIMRSVVSNEAYPHHENYPESPGHDQGQLTARLPGSTPLLEELIIAYRKQRERTQRTR